MKTFLAIVLVTQVVKAQEDRLRSIVKEGIDLHDKQDYRGALSKYCQALLLDRESPLVNYEIACSYSAMKMYDSAIWHSDQVIASSNEALALQAMILKGAAIDDKGNTQEAIDYYKHILIKYPEHYLLLYNYAVSCGRLGLADESGDALTKALRNRISHSSSNLKLAYLKAGKGENVSAIFGLYFFLLLENNTERSAEALNALFAALYAEPKIDSVITDDRGNRNVRVNMAVEAKADRRMTFAEIAIMEITSASLELNKGKTFSERFVLDTERIFDALGELINTEDGNMSDVLWNVYIPYFHSLKQAGHTEAFCYHALSASKEEKLRILADSNRRKLEYFYLWANTN